MGREGGREKGGWGAGDEDVSAILHFSPES